MEMYSFLPTCARLSYSSKMRSISCPIPPSSLPLSSSVQLPPSNYRTIRLFPTKLHCNRSMFLTRRERKLRKKSGTPTKSNWENCNLNNFTPSPPSQQCCCLLLLNHCSTFGLFSLLTLEALKIHYDYSLFFHLPCVSFHHYSILRKKRGLGL